MSTPDDFKFSKWPGYCSKNKSGPFHEFDSAECGHTFRRDPKSFPSGLLFSVACRHCGRVGVAFLADASVNWDPVRELADPRKPRRPSTARLRNGKKKGG